MPLPWKFSIAISQLQPVDLDRLPDLCREAGVDRLEGTAKVFDRFSDADLSRLASRFHDAGVRFDTYHLPYETADDVSSFYETIRRGSVDRARRGMERSLVLGARIGIQHPTTCFFGTEVEGWDRMVGQLRKSMDELLPLAERLGYTIALENVPKRVHGPRLGSIPGHIAILRESFNHPSLGFCLDTGHALMSVGLDGEEGYFDAAGAKLVAFHLADNSGDRDLHLAPGRGLVNWTTVFRRAHRLGFTGTMCIETPPFSPGPPHAPAAMRQLIADTTALAEKALG